MFLVIPGRCDASNPESRHSGMGLTAHPGMTMATSLTALANE